MKRNLILVGALLAASATCYAAYHLYATSLNQTWASQDTQERYAMTTVQQHKATIIVLFLSAALALFLSSWYLLWPYDRKWIYWLLSAWFSCLAFTCSFTILYIYYWYDPPMYTSQNFVLSDARQTDAFLNQNAMYRHIHTKSQHLIPTGILIKSFTIQNEHTIEASGSIWQIYGPEDQQLEKDVVIANARKSDIKPTYQRKTERGTVQGYDFRAELIQQLNYRRFPLDRQHIHLELTHSSLTEPIILVPDFASWNFEASRNIGIDPNLKPAGIIIENTYFSYALKKSITTKGLDDYVFADDFPVLNFNIDIKREVINLLILAFLPVITILVLSFAFLLMFRRLFSRPHSYISINTAILFALVVSHQRLRDLIPSSVPSYPEYTYFLSYIIILFNIMLAVRYVKTLGSDETIKSMPKETFFFRMAYWPFVATMFLIITAFFFI